MIDRRLKLEALERRLLLAADFGDAPAPYDTLLADNGARHEAVGPMLGASRDSEADGLPSLNADGDGVDDDGVTFGTIRVGQLDASVTVNIQNAPLGAKLDAWIDFNGDGNWGGASERIAASVSVVEGDNVIEFDVPVSIAAGPTYARFRLSTGGSLNVSGPAVDGEVEDYRITITSSVPSLGFSANEHAIELTIRMPGSTQLKPTTFLLSDFDGDGQNEVVVGAVGAIYLMKLDATGNWVERDISDYGVGSEGSLATADIDLDGDLDLIAGLYNSNDLAWSENVGNDSFLEHLIPTPASSPTTIRVADLDGDGDLDVVAASPSTKVVWYENDGSQHFAERLVSTYPLADYGVHTVHPIDLDRDGDLDFAVGAKGFFGELVWYEMTVPKSFAARDLLSTNYISAIAPIDFDRDGDLDIIYAVDDRFSPGYDHLSLLINNGSGSYISRVLTRDVSNPTDIDIADLNGDGELDFLVGSSVSNSLEVFVSGPLLNYSKYTLLTGSEGRFLKEVSFVDMDGDGDLDVGAIDQQNELIWFEALPTEIHAAPSLLEVQEDNGMSSMITFTRTGDLSAEAIFNFAVLGSATFDTDYTVAGATAFDITSGSIAFLAGESTATLTITPIADADFEGNETVIIRIADYADIGLPEQPTNPTDAVVTILHDEPVDFGDAADTYVTTAANNGPSHGATGPTLGADRDSETDGQPAQLADGDGADDDGITVGTLRVGQQDAIITVNVQNAPAGARLDAWFDFNGDGNFFDPDEQVTVNLVLAEGGNAVPIDIPATARSGETTARFRLSTAGSLSYVGYAVDGEVEDYRVTILPPAAADGVFSTRPPISTSTLGAYDVVTADIDGDGDIDVISAAETGDSIDWHENIGAGQFITHHITTADAAYVARVVDLDQDGDLDLLTAHRTSSLGGGLIWHENDGSQNFTSRFVTSDRMRAYDVHTADMDGDGDLDIVAYGARTQWSVMWYRNDGDQNFSQGISIAEPTAAGKIALADLNQDGRIDIIAPVTVSFSGSKLMVLVNDGAGNFVKQVLFFLTSGTATNCFRRYC